MNIKIDQEVVVRRPTPGPLNSSVLAHATVVENADFGMRNNTGLWPSYNCLDTLIPTPICPDPLQDVTKNFSTAEWVPGFEFAVYGGAKCSAVGLDVEDQASEVKRVFNLNEGRGVEQALLFNRFVANIAGSDTVGPYWDAPTDLGSAPSILSAIGILEGYAASHYAGIPTLHLPRAVITMGFGAGALVERDGKFFTKAGSKIAAGGGYDHPDNVSTGDKEFHITGEVYVERSEEVNIQTYVLPGDGSGLGSGENGLADNTVLTLAERMYRVGIDCFSAMVTASVWTS